VKVDTAAGHLDETEVDAFVNARWLITVPENEGFPIDPVLSRWDVLPIWQSTALPSSCTACWMSWSTVISTPLRRVLRRCQRRHLRRPATRSQQATPLVRNAPCHGALPSAGGSHALGGQLAHAARAIRRFRSSVSLLPGCLHHILRVTESSDSLRDLVSTIVETNFSLRDFRQNLFVKKVSSWAAIIAVPALVTGYYGMNVPYPGSGWPSGVITSTELIGILSFGLYILFRKRDWL